MRQVLNYKNDSELALQVFIKKVCQANKYYAITLRHLVSL